MTATHSIWLVWPLQERATEWRRRFADGAPDDGKAYGDYWDKARREVGDECWSPGDDTDYSVVELKKGPAT
jgi:hypothetical protein